MSKKVIIIAIIAFLAYIIYRRGKAVVKQSITVGDDINGAIELP